MWTNTTGADHDIRNIELHDLKNTAIDNKHEQWITSGPDMSSDRHVTAEEDNTHAAFIIIYQQ